MAHRIITGPLRLTGLIHPEQIAILVAIDSLIRRRSSVGVPTPTLEVLTVAGDLALQHATQEVLDDEAIEAADAETLEEETLSVGARVEALLDRLFSQLRITADTHRWRAGDPEIERIARVAFVRLYDAGLLVRTEAVLDSCPGCQTVLDETDVNETERDVPVFRVAVPSGESQIVMNLSRPELLLGAVAIAVPVGTKEESTAQLPVIDTSVPIVEVQGVGQPTLVVPGHDALSFEIAKNLGLRVKQMFDGEGIVRVDGPFDAMGVASARSAIVEQLSRGGYLVDHAEGRVVVRTCHRCDNELIPLLGVHWILPMSTMSERLGEVVAENQISFYPEAAAEDFVGAMNRNGAWTLSQQLWAGVKVPIAVCLDCNAVTVSVDDATSCGSCMGTLQPQDDVIDGRFVAAITPLAMMGWPGPIADELDVALVLSKTGVSNWAAPVAALGLMLANVLPFNQVFVKQFYETIENASAQSVRQLSTRISRLGADVVRAAYLTGEMDPQVAAENVNKLCTQSSPDQMNADQATPVDWETIGIQFDKFLSDLCAGDAFELLMTVANAGAIFDEQGKQQFVDPLLGLQSQSQINSQLN